MRNQAIFAVLIDGTDITARLADVLISIMVKDETGTGADTATILLDDSARNLTFPKHNAKCRILLGHRNRGVGVAFEGMIDEIRSTGGRATGRLLQVSAKGLDTSGKAKEPQKRHFDNKSIADILAIAGDAAGVTDVRVDQELGAIVREYEQMDGESFIAFGERLAKEVGGTFKLRNDIAVFAKKGAGRAPSGAALPPVRAIWGDNLIEWDIAPYIGRARYKEIRVKYYDKKTGAHGEEVVVTEVEGSNAIAVGRFEAPTKEAAKEKAESLKAESEAGSGAGTVTIEGSVAAQPEAPLILVGARPGVDLTYTIDGVEHELSRASGFVTRVSLAHPV